MWEITHPFAYTTDAFVASHTRYLRTLQQSDLDIIRAARHGVRTALDPNDWEYLAWQEWKEGLARWVENGVRARLALPLNTGGREPPYTRVSFYASGAGFIAALHRANPTVAAQPLALWDEIAIL